MPRRGPGPPGEREDETPGGTAAGPSGPIPRVFITYRRGDTSGYAGRIYDSLSARFGHQNVFMDIDAIDPGEEFDRIIEDAMNRADVVIALIGTRYLAPAPSGDLPRIFDPDDWVRLEIKEALNRDDVRVIPVLVEGARPPSSTELPDDIRSLARRQAFEVNDARFHSDMDRLVTSIVARFRGMAPAPAPVVQPEPIPEPEPELVPEESIPESEPEPESEPKRPPPPVPRPRRARAPKPPPIPRPRPRREPAPDSGRLPMGS